MGERWSSIYDDYVAELPTWEALAELAHQRLERLLVDLHIHGWIFARAKDPESFTRNVILKNRRPDEIGDKAAARVVVAYEEQLPLVENAIRDSFNVISAETKLDALAYDQVGYLGVHLDARLRDDDAEGGPFGRRRFEVQLRTVAQWAWAEVSHEQLYKPAVEAPDELKRRIYRLVSLVELFDGEVAGFLDEARSLPGYQEAAILPPLADELRTRFGILSRYDRQLARELAAAIAPLYDVNVDEIYPNVLQPWIQSKEADLRVVLERLRREHHPLTDQPVLLTIFERLDSAPATLRAAWPDALPVRTLERLAHSWGREV